GLVDEDVPGPFADRVDPPVGEQVAGGVARLGQVDDVVDVDVARRLGQRLPVGPEWNGVERLAGGGGPHRVTVEAGLHTPSPLGQRQRDVDRLVDAGGEQDPFRGDGEVFGREGGDLLHQATRIAVQAFSGVDDAFDRERWRTEWALVPVEQGVLVSG